MQATPEDQLADWCFDVRWAANAEDAFFGRVDALLVTRKHVEKEMVARIEDLFAAEGSPFAAMGRPSRREAEVMDLKREFFCPLSPGEEEVGISSSGADALEAEELVAALKAAGLRAVWYRIPECRSGEDAKVKVFMERRLRNAPCLVVLLSDAYLRDDPVENWYCPWELADAILRSQDGGRSIERTFVIYKADQTLNSGNFGELVTRVFRKFAKFFWDAYAGKDVDEQLNFSHYGQISGHFTQAWHAGAVGKFFEQRGTLGAYSQIALKPGGTRNYSAVVEDIRKALRRS